MLTNAFSQIRKPNNVYQIHERSISSGDHSFEADADGRYEYCFSNEAWSAHTKEISFNVHGIVYVPESESPQDPFEKEGMTMNRRKVVTRDESLTTRSTRIVRAHHARQRRAILHRHARTHAPQHRREHQRPSQVVEYFPAGRLARRGSLPGLVVEAILRGQRPQQTQLHEGRARLTHDRFWFLQVKRVI